MCLPWCVCLCVCVCWESVWVSKNVCDGCRPLSSRSLDKRYISVYVVCALKSKRQQQSIHTCDSLSLFLLLFHNFYNCSFSLSIKFIFTTNRRRFELWIKSATTTTQQQQQQSKKLFSFDDCDNFLSPQLTLKLNRNYKFEEKYIFLSSELWKYSNLIFLKKSFDYKQNMFEGMKKISS